MHYDPINDWYLLNDDNYAKLSGKSGWEDGGTENGQHIVFIFDDELLNLLNAGSYHGGEININNSQQGGPM